MVRPGSWPPCAGAGVPARCPPRPRTSSISRRWGLHSTSPTSICRRPIRFDGDERDLPPAGIDSATSTSICRRVARSRRMARPPPSLDRMQTFTLPSGDGAGATALSSVAFPEAAAENSLQSS
nr:unnamed protein product [Digitaria exilis]CAB3505102.1 unnamed protein product [Digitaria exilis]